jgi:hypothetical protein
MKKLYFLLFLLITILNLEFVSSQNSPAYEQRRNDYIDNALLNPNGNIINLEAYRGLPITQQYLDDIYSVMFTKPTIDFDLVRLVRVLFLTNGSYDSQILSAIDTLPFWVNNYDTIRGYWSENHMNMWMSSNWLLHESYGFDADSNLYQRLNHYLDLKAEYGYYEFFSGIYLPYSLSGLLNLYDFAQDTVIKEKARVAALRLLSDVLLVTNNQGVFYPASGRSSHNMYANPYNSNIYNIIYLLTGFGNPPSSVSHGASFLSTSSIDVSSVVNGFTNNVDTIYKVGHSIDSVRIVHGNLVDVDRVMMQWSSGCYFHPEFALETATLITDSNMWNHVDFQAFNMVAGIDLGLVEAISEAVSSISKSSVLTGVDLAIFKNHNVGMASTQDYWKGKLGYNQIPMAATVGKTAVMTISGEFVTDWTQITKANRNDHLPYINQKSNVALIMYRGEEKVSLFGETIADVMLQWYENDFDETEEDGNWLFGKQDENYVAVRRHCLDKKQGVYTCEERDGQTWIIIVGNDLMYNSYQDFKNLALASTFETSWTYDSTSSEWIYASSIEFDTITIEHEWVDEKRFFTSTNNQFANQVNDLKIYPNPSNNVLNIDLSKFESQHFDLLIINQLGQEVYKSNYSHANNIETIDVSTWNSGIYFIKIQDENQQIYRTKFMKN